MRLTLVGSGNTHGVPRKDCTCAACMAARSDATRSRQPTCGLIQLENKTVCIDTGAPAIVPFLTATRHILLTHFHPDHIEHLPFLTTPESGDGTVYCPKDPERSFPLPLSWRWQTLEAMVPFSLGELLITPIELRHTIPTLGFAVDDGEQRFAWLCDTRELPNASLVFLRSFRPHLVVLDCSFVPGDPDGPKKLHGDLDSCLSLGTALGQPRTILAHLDHTLDTFLRQTQPQLPSWMELGHDQEILL